ncbi:DoxX family protein [Xylophilus sp.]|uniref:DoxX family protein n=1 Tax=Xylophilus sp. TaxID=2653893 RepID=UPI0013BC4BB2|nr:DoxX family protein [Xylophilus sp.]KAF1044008.1 MAG: Inner membrane protein YphA [Xylophilus sp.]
MSVSARNAALPAPHPAAALVSRLLFAALFLPSGIGKIQGFEGTVGSIASKGLPLPAVLAAAAILFEVGGSLALILGVKTRWAAWGLALFTLIAAFAFHNYWAVAPELVQAQKINFYKNLAIVGGLLALAGGGAGAWSLDGRHRG